MQENKQKTRWNNNQTLCICTSKQTKQVNSTNCVRNYSCKTEKTGNEFWQIKKYANARKREKEICDLWQKKEANTQTKKRSEIVFSFSIVLRFAPFVYPSLTRLRRGFWQMRARLSFPQCHLERCARPAYSIAICQALRACVCSLCRTNLALLNK